MNAAELKRKVEGTGSPFFSRGNMRFFGDTMSNFGVCETTWRQVVCYELYRRRPVKHGLQKSHFFKKETFEHMGTE